MDKQTLPITNSKASQTKSYEYKNKRRKTIEPQNMNKNREQMSAPQTILEPQTRKSETYLRRTTN